MSLFLCLQESLVSRLSWRIPQVDFYFDHLHLWRWEKLKFSIKTAKLAFAVPEAAGAYVIKYAIDLFALNPFLNTLISDVCAPRMSS